MKQLQSLFNGKPCIPFVWYRLFVLYIILFLCTDLTAQKKEVSIGILTDALTQEIELIFEQLKEQITVVVGEDATIRFDESNTLVNGFNLERAAQYYQQFLDNDIDIILAFGAVNNIVIGQQTSYPKPTILFGAVNRDLVSISSEQTTSGVENFTYLIQSESYQQDITKLKELTDFGTVGIILERQIVDVLPAEEVFDRELEELGADYKLIPFSTIDDVLTSLDGIDAVYLAGGLLLSVEERKQLAAVCIEKELPALTNTDIEDVVNGFFATNRGQNDFQQFQRRIALTVEAYINGASLAEMPIYLESEPRLTINYNTAELVGVPIKYSLITSTDFVGELRNVVSEKDYNLLDAINQALDQNFGLAASEKDIRLSAQDVAIAKSEFLPKVEAGVTGSYVDPNLAEVSFGQNPEFSTAGTISAEQLIYSPAAKANIAIQKQLLKAQEQNFNTTQLDLIFDVSSLYLTSLIFKANSLIQLRNLDLTKRNLRLAEQNFDAGESGKSDVLRFRSQVAQNTQTMVEAINQMEQGFVRLNQVLNNKIEMEIDIEDVELDKGVFENYNYDELVSFLDDPKQREPFIQFLVGEDLKNAPEVKELDYNIEATRLSADLFKRGRYYPTIAAQGQYNVIINRNGAGSETTLGAGGATIPNSNYNLGINVALPLFNRNTNNINQQNAQIQQEQLNINRQNLELAISAGVRNNVLNLINQVANIDLSEVSETTALEALELSQIAYSSGSTNIIQLLDAQNNYLNAQLARASAVYNFLINAIQLERSLGYYFLLNSEEDNASFRQRFQEYILNNSNNN
ncbi:MAG: TolC family protein [Bacteroidota bacterium]